jgi:hypothetical protein
MEWGLFVLGVLFVALVQFAVWRRLQNSDVGAPESRGRSETGRPADLPNREDGDDPPVRDGTDDPDTRLCPSCGAENAVDYQFCRECVGMLQP